MAFPQTSDESIEKFETQPPPLEVAGSAPSAEKLEGLSRVLRAVGAGVLLASASSFLLQNWATGGDIARYYTLLGHTVALAVLGFVWGLRANDAKGARTFLALAGGLVPANICILGGLVYSQFSWEGGATQVAHYASWVAPSASAALLAVGVSLASLAGVMLLAFLSLARERARILTALYLGVNALMLIPSRDPSLVAVVAGLQLIALGVFEGKVVRVTSSLRTLEGRFVRTMLFAPPVLVLLRSALHYELSAAFVAVATGALAAGSFALALESRIPAVVASALRGLSLASLACSAASLAAAFVETFGLPASVALPVAGTAFGASATGLSLLAGDALWGGLYRRAAAAAVLGTFALDLWVFPGVVSSITCGVASIVTLSYGFLWERRGLFVAGLAGAVLAVLTQLRAAIELYAWSHWGSLALLGVAVVLAATAVERHGEALGERAAFLRRRFNDWA
jgi:hypothetical protein